ncbi:MAG TPA: hypothetical protein VFL86_13205 [Burkholderiaceae bacterium]|nr:hypothetical protein [Burkholderiaceae bacterium]
MTSTNLKQVLSPRNTLAAVLGLGLFLGSFGAMAHAGGRDHNSRVERGTIRCGGNYFARLVGTPDQELHYVNYVFRNRSSKGSISVDRVVFYDATGTMIYDSRISGFPAFSNQVLGPGDQVLKPNQTGQLDVSTFFSRFLEPWQRPMQLEVTWSSRDGAVPLSLDLIRLVQRVNPVTGARGSEVTRDSQDCDAIESDD